MHIQNPEIFRGVYAHILMEATVNMDIPEMV